MYSLVYICDNYFNKGSHTEVLEKHTQEKCLQITETLKTWIILLFLQFSKDSFHSSDVYRCESGGCRSLPLILKYFLTLETEVNNSINFLDLTVTKTDAHPIYTERPPPRSLLNTILQVTPPIETCSIPWSTDSSSYLWTKPIIILKSVQLNILVKKMATTPNSFTV